MRLKTHREDVADLRLMADANVQDIARRRGRMTNDEINKAVAEKVMGWQLSSASIGEFWKEYKKDGTWILRWMEDWNPAERIDHAWVVVEKMAEKFHWSIRSPFYYGEPWFAGLTPHGATGWNGVPDFDCHSDTAPMAICLAALEAMEEP